MSLISRKGVAKRSESNISIGLQPLDDTPGEEDSAGEINWRLKTQIACVVRAKE